MRVEILTLFPEIFSSFLETSLVQKAISKKLLQISLNNIRNFADPPHFQVDDSPYGGGAGMLMKPEPLVLAIESAKTRLPKAKVVLLSPRGKPFTQSTANQWKEREELVFVCGRYEGVDQRVIDLMIDEEVSIGDYILMGGEVPAMVIIESVTRLLPGVLGNEDSLVQESFHPSHNGALLEAPQYTRPPEFRGLEVPAILLSGNHQAIAEWRHEQSVEITRRLRPDLVQSHE